MTELSLIKENAALRAAIQKVVDHYDDYIPVSINPDGAMNARQALKELKQTLNDQSSIPLSGL